MELIQRYNGWEISQQSDGPLVRYESVREAVDQHNELVQELEETKKKLRLYAGAIEYMSQYNGRTVRECLDLARADYLSE